MWLSKISWTNKSLLLQHLLINSTLLHELPSHNGFFKNFFLLQTLFVHYLFPFFLYLNFISCSMHFCYSCFVWCKKNKNKNKKNHKKNSKTQKKKKILKKFLTRGIGIFSDISNSLQCSIENGFLEAYNFCQNGLVHDNPSKITKMLFFRKKKKKKKSRKT